MLKHLENYITGWSIQSSDITTVIEKGNTLLPWLGQSENAAGENKPYSEDVPLSPDQAINLI